MNRTDLHSLVDLRVADANALLGSGRERECSLRYDHHRGQGPRSSGGGHRSSIWCSDMAEDTMVKDLLTDTLIKAGADLTKKLDEVEWPVVASFWLYLPELNTWKL